MEKEAKNDNRTILSSELLNENTLLVVSKKEDGYSKLSICYTEEDTLKEDEIAVLDQRTSVEHNDRIIAVFKEVTCLGIVRPLISAVYDIRYHKFVGPDLLNTVYKIRIKDDPKVKKLVNKGGLPTWQAI